MGDARIYLRHVRKGDQAELVALAVAARPLHEPWIAPPRTVRTFNHYYARTLRDDHEGVLVCLRSDDRIAGVINVNNIARGAALSATLGYYADIESAGQGYMAEGLRLVKEYVFSELGLHRLEANIQPDNHRSIALVRRCGFTLEGVAKAFLFIDGAWRDHERWAALDPRATLAREGGLRSRSLVR